MLTSRSRIEPDRGRSARTTVHDVHDLGGSDPDVPPKIARWDVPPCVGSRTRSQLLPRWLAGVDGPVVVGELEVGRRRLVDDDGGVGWSCSTDAGHIAVSGPSTALAIGAAFAEPVATSSRCRASPIVARPCVTTWWGTSSTVEKNRALSGGWPRSAS